MLILQVPIDLVTASATSWKCQETTPVSYLRACKTVDVEIQITADQAAVIQPDSLPDAISNPAQKLNPGLHLVPSNRVRSRHYWANHCVHCGVLHGEYSSHTEPGDPFFGAQVPSSAVSVRLLEVGEYEIDAGNGY